MELLNYSDGIAIFGNPFAFEILAIAQINVNLATVKGFIHSAGEYRKWIPSIKHTGVTDTETKYRHYLDITLNQGDTDQRGNEVLHLQVDGPMQPNLQKNDKYYLYGSTDRNILGYISLIEVTPNKTKLEFGLTLRRGYTKNKIITPAQLSLFVFDLVLRFKKLVSGYREEKILTNIPQKHIEELMKRN